MAEEYDFSLLLRGIAVEIENLEDDIANAHVLSEDEQFYRIYEWNNDLIGSLKVAVRDKDRYPLGAQEQVELLIVRVRHLKKNIIDMGFEYPFFIDAY